LTIIAYFNSLPSDGVHRIDHALASQRKVRVQRDALAMPLVDHRQHAELPPVCQLVVDEIMVQY
jgi:hypothetical protein